MAGVAYYNTGTATATVGSKTVTGTGTNWLSTVGGLTAIKAGDKFGIHVGRPIIIASVDSNTQLTLEDNWPGPAQTNAAYRIELTSPDVIAVEALRRMLGSLSSGVLYGLSQLPSTPSKALTIDENGSAALADLSTLGKSLIASLNSSAAYGVLGAIPEAQLPTRLRAVSSSVTNIDTAIDSGDYTAAATATGHPTGSGVFGFSTIYINTTTQIQIGSTAGNVWYTRAKSSGTWGAWGRLPNFGTDNIIPNASLPTRLRELSTAVTDADTALTNGMFAVAPTATNIPEAVAGTLIVSMYTASTYGVQIYVRLSSSANNVWYRARSNGNWLAWRRMDGDLSGPGAAVPNNGIAGFIGTSGYSIKALSVLEALGNLGPVFGGVSPEPVNAGVGMANGDFDTIIYPGVYTIAGNWNNGPLAPALTHTGVLTVQARSYNNLYIQRLRLQDGRVFKRIATAASGAWQAWGITEGDVSGPSSSVDGAFVQSSGTTGKVLKAASIATATILGRSSSGAGAVEQLSAAQARSVISVPSVAEMNTLVTTARQVRLGAEASIATTASAWNKATNSAVLTGVYLGSGFTVNNIAFRTVQQTDLSGNWVAVAQV